MSERDQPDRYGPEPSWKTCPDCRGFIGDRAGCSTNGCPGQEEPEDHQISYPEIPDNSRACVRTADNSRLTPHQLWREKAIWLLDALMDATRELRESSEVSAMLAHLDEHPSLTSNGMPEGWKLVPIEPTVEMCLADWNVGMSDAHSTTGVSRCAWDAMLSVAPKYQPDEEGGAEAWTDCPQVAGATCPSRAECSRGCVRTRGVGQAARPSDEPGSWTCKVCGFRGFWSGGPHCSGGVEEGGNG